MSLSSLAIGLIAGIGGASLLLIVALLFVLRHRRSSRSTPTSKSLEQGVSSSTNPTPVVLSVIPLGSAQESAGLTAKAQEALMPHSLAISGSPYTPTSPPPIYQSHKTDDSYSSMDKKMPPISPPTIVTNLTRYSGITSSPFGIPLSPILASPNPRTASYNSKVSSTIPSLRPSVAAELSGSWLPRYMTVCATFTPRSEDEMLVTPGENLRLLEMFEDDWCLVQRVGKLEGELGVIPTFCLAEPQPMTDAKGRLEVPQPPFVGKNYPRAK